MVSEGKRWALVAGSQSTLSSADESLAGGIGPLRFGRGLAWPGRACGIGRGLGKAALGCGGLRWAVALDLLGARDQAASLRGVSGGRSGVRGGLRQPLVWNGSPGSVRSWTVRSARVAPGWCIATFVCAPLCSGLPCLFPAGNLFPWGCRGPPAFRGRTAPFLVQRLSPNSRAQLT